MTIKLYEEFITRQQQVKTKFNTLKTKWLESASYHSNPIDLYENIYYKEIIELGKDVIPLLIEDLDSPMGDWYCALNKITGENPIQNINKGITKKMTEDWKKWYGSIKENWFDKTQSSQSFPIPSYIINNFPNISHGNTIFTSPETKEYNCISWAYGIIDKQMWPNSSYKFWPKGVINDDSQKSFIDLFESIGYNICDNGEIEDGYEKIALFELHGFIKHAAKQTSEHGKWHSKFGTGNDGIHTMEALEDGGYGIPKIYMKRIVDQHLNKNQTMSVTNNPKNKEVRRTLFGRVFKRNK